MALVQLCTRERARRRCDCFGNHNTTTLNEILVLVCIFRDWYHNASCRTWFRRKPLSGAFTHPSKMVYPPGHKYTPEPTPEPTPKELKEPRTWEAQLPPRPALDYEIGSVKSESQ